MSPVALFSPVCTEPSQPTRFDLFRTNRYPTLARLQPEHPLLVSFGLPHALSLRLFHSSLLSFVPFRLTPSGKIRGRIEQASGAWAWRIINRVPLFANRRYLRFLDIRDDPANLAR